MNLIGTGSATTLCSRTAFGGVYAAYDPQGKAVKKDSDMYKALHVLARDVGILGIFSDWPGTVSYYASCMGLR